MARFHSDNYVVRADHRPDISALASTVLSVLNQKDAKGDQTIRASIVQNLVTEAMNANGFQAERLWADVTHRGVSDAQLIDFYIPQAARILGEMWSTDRISFAKVTIGTARLQILLGLIAPSWDVASTNTGEASQILMVMRTDDHHTLGPLVAAAQLRRLGARVRLLFDPSITALVKAVSIEACDIVLFSSSRTEALASIANLVKGVRNSVLVPPTLVLGGLVLDMSDGLKEATDVDLVTNEVKAALRLCKKKKSRNRSLMP